MGYFDGIIDSNFKIDTEGRSVYYPNGVFGKGYIVPTEQKKKDIRDLLINFHRISLLIIPIVTSISVLSGWFYSLIILLILPLWFLLKIRTHTKGLETTNQKLTWKESYRNSAKSYSPGTLWFLFYGSILFVIIHTFLFFSGTGSQIFNVVGFVFFSAGTISCYRLIKSKHS